MAVLSTLGYEVEDEDTEKVRFADGDGFLYVIAAPKDEPRRHAIWPSTLIM